MAELPSYEEFVELDAVSAEDLANMDEEDQIRLAIEQSRMGTGANNSQPSTAPKQELSCDGMTESVPQSDTTCTASGTTVIMEEDAMLREAIARSQQETLVQGREQPSMDGYEHIDDEGEMLRLVLEQSEREARALEAKQQLEVVKDQFESLRVEEGSEEFKMLLAQSKLTHDAHRVAAQRALQRQEQDEYDRTIHLSAITDKLHGVDITHDQMEKRNKWRAKFDIQDETPAQEVEDDETSFAHDHHHDNDGSDTEDEIANEVSDDDWQPDVDNNAIDEHIPGYMMMTLNDDVSYRDVSDRDGGGGGDEHDGGDDGVRSTYLTSIPNESVADNNNNNNNNNSNNHNNYNNHKHNHHHNRNHNRNHDRTSTYVDHDNQHNHHANKNKHNQHNYHYNQHNQHHNQHNQHHNQPYMTMTPNSEVADFLYNTTANTNHDITNNNDNNDYNTNYNDNNNDNNNDHNNDYNYNDNDYHNDNNNDKQTRNYYMTMTPNDEVSDNTRTSHTRVNVHGQHLGGHSAHVTQMQRDGSQVCGTITPNVTIPDNTNINYALGDSSEDTSGYMIVEPPQTPDLDSAVYPNVTSSTRNPFPKSLSLIDNVDNVALSYTSSNTHSTLPPQGQHTSDIEQRYTHAHTRTHADGDGVGVGSRATSNVTGTKMQVRGSSSSTNSYSIKSASGSKNDITRRSYQFDCDHTHHTSDTNLSSLTTPTTTTMTRSPSTMETIETAKIPPVELKPLKSSRGKHRPSVKTQDIVNTTPLYNDEVQSFSAPSTSSRRREKSHVHTNTYQPLESMSDDSIDTRSLLETVQTVQPVQASDHEPRTFISEKIASKKKIQTNAAGYTSRPAGGRNTSNTTHYSDRLHPPHTHTNTHTNTNTHTHTNTHTNTLTSKPTVKPSPPKQQRLASVPIKDTRAISMAVQRGVQEAYTSTSTPTSASSSQQLHIATKPSLKKAVNRASKIRRESALGDPGKRRSSQNSTGGMHVLSGTGSWS